MKYVHLTYQHGLVFLSACQTSSGKDIENMVLSLNDAFIIAGAQSVISTLDDR